MIHCILVLIWIIDDPNAKPIPDNIVSLLKSDKYGMLAEANGFSMNDGTTMWHVWCRATEEIDLLRVINYWELLFTI